MTWPCVINITICHILQIKTKPQRGEMTSPQISDLVFMKVQKNPVLSFFFLLHHVSFSFGLVGSDSDP